MNFGATEWTKPRSAMSWLAELIDGPLAGQTIRIDDDHADSPPPQITVEGCRYWYCGWRDSSPRYSYHGEGGGNDGGRSPRVSRAGGFPKPAAVPPDRSLLAIDGSIAIRPPLVGRSL
jgi:hypothetical protein